MPKAKPLTGPNGGPVLGHVIMCPACKSWHMFDDPVHGKHPRGVGWEFNGDLNSPTFSPSMLVHGHTSRVKRCHSFVRNGMIEYCSDCEHELAGATVELPDVDHEWDE